MDYIKDIVLQHFSKQVSAFLLSYTSKLLVWNNQYNTFGLKQIQSSDVCWKLSEKHILV